MEMVFEPETGVSVPRGSSLRYGFELEARYQPRSDIYLYLDYFATTAVFMADRSDIPGTPEGTVTLGGNYEGRSGLGVSFRTRVMAPRPLASGVYSRPYSVTDAAVNYRNGDWRFELAVENLFDQEWDDTSFYYESRPDPAAPSYEQLHITPGTPLSVKLSLVWGF
jgi:outer membrane receptor protein involved in Fe transport